MIQRLSCPACKTTDLNVRTYDSMMVLRPDFALFTLRCPACGARVSALHPIPADMREEVQYAAVQVGAGMGMGMGKE